MAKNLIYTKRRQLKRRGASRRLNLETLYVVRNARSARPCMREFLREAQNVHLIEPKTVLNIKWGVKNKGSRWIIPHLYSTSACNDSASNIHYEHNFINFAQAHWIKTLINKCQLWYVVGGKARHHPRELDAITSTYTTTKAPWNEHWSNHTPADRIFYHFRHDGSDGHG